MISTIRLFVAIFPHRLAIYGDVFEIMKNYMQSVFITCNIQMGIPPCCPYCHVPKIFKQQATNQKLMVSILSLLLIPPFLSLTLLALSVKTAIQMEKACSNQYTYKTTLFAIL